MKKLAIISPLPAISSTASSGTGAANLITPDPKEIWVAGVAGIGTLSIDLGKLALVDSCFVGGSNIPIGAVIVIYGSVNVSRSDKTFIALARVDVNHFRDGRINAAAFGADAKFCRYIDIDIINVNTTVLQVGIVAVGKVAFSKFGHEYGSARGVSDTGQAESLIGGGFGISLGAKKKTYSWVFGDLTSAEAKEFEGIALTLGTSSAVVVMEYYNDDTSTFTNVTNTTVTTDVSVGYAITKSTGVAGYNAAAYSALSFPTGSYVTFRAGQTNQELFFGLTRTPSGVNPATLDAAFLLNNAGLASAYRLGVPLSPTFAYTTSSVFAVLQMNNRLQYYIDGALVWESTTSFPDAQWYAGGCFNGVGGIVNRIDLQEAGSSEALHYGLARKSEPIERLGVDIYRYALSIEEWV